MNWYFPSTKYIWTVVDEKNGLKRAKWKIVQMSTHIMRQEAQRRGEVIRNFLMHGYKLRSFFHNFFR